MLESDRDATIIVIGNRSEDPDFARRATSRASVIFVSKPHPPVWRSERFPVCEFLLDFGPRVPQLTSAIQSFLGAEPVAAVIAQTESGLVPAQLMQRHFCPSRPDDLEAARTLRDKSRMRALLAQHRFSPVGVRSGHDENDILAALTTYGDVIVKPVDGCGSSGIARVRTAADARHALAVHRALKNDTFLIEEYLDGPEFSVETFTFDGDHRVIAVTEKRTLAGTFVEVAHIVPATLSADALRRVSEHTIAFLNIVGLRNGPAHTELRLTARGPRIIESQNRVGGDRINVLVKAVYGIDMMDLAFDWALGRTAPLGAIPAADGAAAVRFFLPQPGILRGLAGLDALDAAPNVLDWEIEPKVGERIRLPITSFRRSGFVAASGATPAAALANADAAGSRVRFDIEPIPRATPAPLPLAS